MHTQIGDCWPRTFLTRSLAAALALCLSGPPLAEPVYADPPDWAPAHGYRAKHKKHAKKFELHDDYRYRQGSRGEKKTVTNGATSAQPSSVRTKDVTVEKAATEQRKTRRQQETEELMRKYGSVYEGARDKGAR